MAEDYVLALLPSGGVELMATPRNHRIIIILRELLLEDC
jgi:hypothetical protein